MPIKVRSAHPLPIVRAAFPVPHPVARANGRTKVAEYRRMLVRSHRSICEGIVLAMRQEAPPHMAFPLRHAVGLIRYWRADARRRDADNVVGESKAAIDCIVRGGILADDSMDFVHGWLTSSRLDPEDHPRKPDVYSDSPIPLEPCVEVWIGDADDGFAVESLVAVWMADVAESRQRCIDAERREAEKAERKAARVGKAKAKA
jgi:Holliday junction resolvase RusA-like endonuclease